MISGKRVEQMADAARKAGVDPLIVATTIIEMVAEESGLACRHCRQMLGRQIVGALMELGWSMPGDRDGQAP